MSDKCGRSPEYDVVVRQNASTGYRFRLYGFHNHTQWLQVTGENLIFCERSLIHSLDQQQFCRIVWILRRRGAMGSTGYVGMENPITSPAVPVPKHRGIDIAEEENGDAKHRHPASHVLVTTNSLHLSCKDRQKRPTWTRTIQFQRCWPLFLVFRLKNANIAPANRCSKP